MTTIFEIVNTALASISPAVPFAMAPYQVTGGLPDEYLTYQVIDSPAEQHADDVETLRSYLVQVSIYKRVGLASLPDVDGAMVTAGFSKGSWRQLPYSQETGHYGLAKDFTILI